MLALQAAAGNRAVAKLLRDPTTLLTPAAAAGAASDVSTRFTEDSIRLLEDWAGQSRDGSFSAADAEAFAKLQKDTLHVAPTGKADEATLTALLKLAGPTPAPRDALIHVVVERAKLNVSGLLGVEYDHTAPAGGLLDSQPGGVGIVRLGDSAFASYGAMVAEVKKQLSVKAPGAAATPVDAAVLADPAAQERALNLNRKLLDDRRSVRILQGATRAKATGEWDAATVRHLAAMQQAHGLNPGGYLTEATMEMLAADLIARGFFDAVLQLIVDYYDLNRSHTLELAFNQDGDPANPTAMGKTLGVGPDMGIPGVVHIYPLAFEQPYAGLVHVVAHELGHIDQVMHGISSLDVREFLSRGIEIESRGMPEESIESDADIDLMIKGEQPLVPGFLQDVNQMLHHWGRMTAAEKTANHARFIQLRDITTTRIRMGTATQQSKLAPMLPLLARADAGVP